MVLGSPFLVTVCCKFLFCIFFSIIECLIALKKLIALQRSFSNYINYSCPVGIVVVVAVAQS